MSTTASGFVRKARVLKQLTMGELARLSGVQKSSISRIEAGKANPTFDTVMKLLTAAGYEFNGDLVHKPNMDEVERTVAAAAGERVVPDEFMMLRAVAQTAPVQFREGMRTYDTSISEAFNWFEENTPGKEGYAISGLEAVNGSTSRRPIVYIDPDVELPWESYPNIRGTIITLPYTERERRFTETENGVRFMTERWALIDALASPGRQSDSALRYLDELTSSPRLKPGDSSRHYRGSGLLRFALLRSGGCCGSPCMTV